MFLTADRLRSWKRVCDGGEAFVKTGRLGVMATRGYVAAAVSQPGYGKSDGPPDYCGPFTQDAVQAAVEFLRRQTFIDPTRIALYGYSRGAIVASMVATKVAAVVLGAGAYDFFSWLLRAAVGFALRWRRGKPRGHKV